MLQGQVLSLPSCALVFALFFICSTALPKCGVGDDSCREKLMHPDLPNVVKSRKRGLDDEKTNDFWINHSQEFIEQKLSSASNLKRAKNVIMFLGDGMGLTTIAAARNILGGEEKQLSFEQFPFTGLSKTYSVDKIVPDSACTATAYLCGVKAQVGTIGLSGNVERGDCQEMLNTENHIKSIAQWAIEAGKWAGVVTTTRITHASPSGAYAHIADREWEDDTQVNADCGLDSGVPDIAHQLIHGETGSKLKFMMGGGRKHFRSSRSDGRNLIDEYQKQNPKNLYFETRSELIKQDMTQADRIMGLFQESHMLYHLETNETTDQPTLEEMTRKAIEFLSQNTEGYFIFIEGGRIDLAHHDNMARLALDETVEFSKAIQAARDITDEDTLIVVTADHSHAFSFSGYPHRGSDIFGSSSAKSKDSMPYLTLSYANGPSYENFYDKKQHKRHDPTQVLKGDPHDMFPATLPLVIETHGGDDVPVFASGPWSHLFTGVYEQNSIPHMMSYASCLGPGITMCNFNNKNNYYR